jgi:drug/metabolite transporter (DMT)-like permease
MVGAFLFFRETIKKRRMVALILALFGIFLASGIQISNMSIISITGIAWALVAAISCALFFLLSQYILKDMNPWTVTFYVHLLSLFLICILQVQDLLLIPQIQGRGVFLVFCMSIVSTVTPFFLMLVGIQLIGASKTSICATLEMPSTIFLAYLFLAEILLPQQFAGGALILLGVLLLYWEQTNSDLA